MDKGKRTEDNERVTREDWKEFEQMRYQLTDIVSNKVFKNGIISPEDRELLRKFLREIKDVINDIETVPFDIFDIVFKQKLTERKVLARKEYQRMMKALNDGGNIASVLKDEGLIPAFSRSPDLLDPLNAQFNINAGYESDGSSVTTDGKTILKIENKMDGSNRSSASIDNDKNSDKVLFYNKPDLYGGSTRYFIDDYEAASTLSVSSGDNWTFKKSTLSMETANDDSNTQRHQNGPYRDSKFARDIYQYSNKQVSELEERRQFSSTLYKGQEDRNDENDYDDTVIPPVTDEKCHETDVDDVLGDFDYLNDYQSQSGASNVSFCGSETSFGSDEKNVKHNDQTKRKGSFDNKTDTVNAHKDNTNVNDVLGVFDYLNEYHSRTNSTSTASLYDSDDDIGLDNEITPIANIRNKKSNKDHITENHENELNFNTDNVWKGDHEDHANLKGKHFDDLQKGFTGYGPLGSNVELHPDNENYSVRPINSKRKDVVKKSSHTNVEERSVMEETSHINIAYGIEDKGGRPFQDTYSAYESNRTDKAFGNKKNLLDKARSEEVVSGFTYGEFILRRTQSEDQNGAFSHKSTQLEVVPEDTFPTSVYDESMEYTRQKNPETDRFDKCDLVIKFMMVILFGIGVTIIVFGIVLREECKWEETILICTITSGGVTICYCVIFLGMNMARKRTIKMSRCFRALLIIIWLILLGLIVAGGVLLYPSIQDYAFKECNGEQDCCRRKFTLITLCAIIIDISCQICFTIGLCRIR